MKTEQAKRMAGFDYEALAIQTRDAYSASSFDDWSDVARLLSARGYDEIQAESILRSKWTRWCRDSWSGNNMPAKALGVWLDRNGYTPTHRDVLALTEKSFPKEKRIQRIAGTIANRIDSTTEFDGAKAIERLEELLRHADDVCQNGSRWKCEEKVDVDLMCKLRAVLSKCRKDGGK